ncbi:MAG: 23S rRNA (adenine(2030)-N(6))-methyltransferase RlmJ, partial [Deinococcus-Thermus bacterium]|nr:23S rRNA (adenine(2030)-N(6))-methyltransferase RlmJ [Deinococcota bacterium]
MNYRHAFHAGNAADVVKHALVVRLIEALQAKPKPICVLDAFAGIGVYDLAHGPATRTGEFRDGIARLLDAPSVPPEAERYVALVRALNPAGAAVRYPGSPALAAALLRDGDRLVAVEQHPEDAAALKAAFAGDGRVQVHRRDGWEAMAALVPPAERRGLVLADPAFEVVDEFARMTAALVKAHARWPTGVYALWYPIKHRPPVDAFLGDLALSGLRRMV